MRLGEGRLLGMSSLTTRSAPHTNRKPGRWLLSFVSCVCVAPIPTSFVRLPTVIPHAADNQKFELKNNNIL